MAAPNAGPYGTTATVYDTAGVDANPIGDPWILDFTGAGAHSDWRRTTDEMAPDTGGGNSQSYKNDVLYQVYPFGFEFWFQLPLVANTNGHFLDISILITDPNTTFDFYFLEITIAAGDDTWDIGKLLNASPSILASGAQNIANDDYVAFSCLPAANGTDTVLEGYWWNGTSGQWELVVEDTDVSSPLRGPGYLGLEATVAATWRILDIRGGPVIVEPTHLYHGISGRGAGW